MVSYQIIGKTTGDAVLKMNSVINIPVDKAVHAWTNGLRERLL